MDSKKESQNPEEKKEDRKNAVRGAANSEEETG